MSWPSWKRLIPPLLAVAVLAAEPAPGATVTESAGGIKYKVKSKLTGVAAFPRDQVNCPPGLHVIGGGYLNKEGFGGFYLRESYPLLKKGGWAYEARSRNGPERRLYGSAICDQKKPIYDKDAFEMAGGESGFGTGRCPDGTHVYSGGAVQIPPFGDSRFATIRSQPIDLDDADTIPDDGWRVYADNHNADGSLYMRATAICGKRTPDYVAAPLPAVPMGTQGGQVATCEEDKPFVYGGGQTYVASWETTAVNTSSIVLDGHEPDRERGPPGSTTTTGRAPTSDLYAVCGKALR